MSKQEFLLELQNALCGLPQDDIQKSLDFYSEMIDDRIEDGLLEEDAIAQIGDIQEIAKQILTDTPITKLVKQKIKRTRRMSALEIVLLVLGSPIWLSLILSAVAVALSVYIVLWSVIISIYAVVFSLAACGVAGVAVFPIFAFKGDMAQGVFLLGCGLVCAGLAILMFMLSKYATKGIIWLSCKIWFLIKRCFVRRGNSNENI